jgi:hypothetical protein
MVDLTVGGSLGELTVKQCNDLISSSASNDELYNPGGNTEFKNGMLFITPKLMPKVTKSMKEKGMAAELLKDTKVDVLKMLVAEDELGKVMQQCKYQQKEFRSHLHKHLTTHKKGLSELTKNFDELGHAVRHLDKHVRMVKTQCDQIAATQSLILQQNNFNRTVSTNIVTRRGTETQDPVGRPWFEEERAEKEKEKQKMSQEEEDLIDPQDDIELEAQREKEKPTSEENDEDEANEQEKDSDSDAETVDPRV